MVRNRRCARCSLVGDERGQALVLAVIVLTALLAMGALAVDLAMAFAARAAAQRAADSAALAGASAFVDITYTDPAAATEAENRAYKYALDNDVLAEPIDSSQVTVHVIPDTQKVRVRIEETELPTWFARVMGIFSMDVAAVAAAKASDGGTSSQCVLPFAMADLWDDPSDDENGNRIPDAGEEWTFEPENGDEYVPYDSKAGSGFDGTGLGSSWRDPSGWIEGDWGRRIWIKGGPPGQAGDGTGEDAGGTDIMIGPGNFYIWEMPDPSNGCSGSPGAQTVQDNILGCNSCEISVGVQYQTQTGNIASIKDELQQVMDMDPNAYWDDGKFFPSEEFPGETSPRIRIVPLWSPEQVMQGKSPVVFNNFAKIFLEGGGGVGKDFAVYARFMGVFTGGEGGPATGSLVKYLRIVE